MEKYYTLGEVAVLCNLTYHALYDHVKRKQIRVVYRRWRGRKPIAMLSQTAIIQLLCSQNWMLRECWDIPIGWENILQPYIERMHALYIQRNALAARLGYSVEYLKQWRYEYGFPNPAIRGGWYDRTVVLNWLKHNRPQDFDRIGGSLN